MDIKSNAISDTDPVRVNPPQAARALGELLRQTPEYEAFLKALKAVNNDLTVQRLGAQMRAHQNALQWGRDGSDQHEAELMRLDQELENLPIVQEYRRVEAEIIQLFRAVDQIITQEAGVDFALNAKRSGCCS